MTAITLTPAQRSALRGLAHGLPVTVHIGQDGVSPAVLKEIDGALSVHGLLKVRVLVAERDAREAMLGAISEALFCAPVQHIGRILVLWRARPEDAVQVQAAPAKASHAPAGGKTRSPRPTLGVRPGAPAGARSASTRSLGEGFSERERPVRRAAAAPAGREERQRAPRQEVPPPGGRRAPRRDAEAPFPTERPRAERGPKPADRDGFVAERESAPRRAAPERAAFGRPAPARPAAERGGRPPRPAGDRARPAGSGRPGGAPRSAASGRPGSAPRSAVGGRPDGVPRSAAAGRPAGAARPAAAGRAGGAPRPATAPRGARPGPARPRAPAAPGGGRPRPRKPGRD